MAFLQTLFGEYARRIALALTAVSVVLLFLFGRAIWNGLTETWAQLATAGVSALVMITIGRWLTLGRGVLAGSSQYDKLLVWSALGLSVVSAVTTTTGLQAMFSANQGNAAVLPVLLAILLGISVQAFMLNNALRIGEGLQRFVPHEAAREEDDDYADAAAERLRRSRPLSLLLTATIVGALAFGLAITFDLTLIDIGRFALGAIGAAEATTGINPLGPALILLALFLLSRTGILPALATLTGLTVSLAVYLAMLLFSSGFGYMFYFVSVQTEEVIATDRDAVIRDRTPALVNQIMEAARLDVDDARVEATAGEAFDDLSERMNALAGIFRNANDDIRAARDAYNQRRQDLANRREQAAQVLLAADAAILAAQQALQRDQSELERLRRDANNRLPGLERERLEAIETRDGELTGEVGEGFSGQPGIGPNWRAANALVVSIENAIAEIEQGLSEAELAVARSAAEVSAAEARRAALEEEQGDAAADEPLPPEIVDPESFTDPLADYAITPTPDTLAEVARACNAGIQLLISAGIEPVGLPDCEVSAVQAALTRWQRAETALLNVNQPGTCLRTPEEEAADTFGQQQTTGADPDVIPEYLRARVRWLVRCMDAANTGSDRMEDVVQEVARLESEYLTPGFDLRRILSAPFEGNRFALFAVLLAVVVDTAILFAGIGANAQRGKILREDHRLVSSERLADRIRNILALIDGRNPGRVAIAILMRAVARPHVAGQTHVFTHEIDAEDSALSDLESRVIKLIMTSAGTDLARPQTVSGRPRWRLHRNLVALLTDIAGGAATAGGQDFNAGSVSTILGPVSGAGAAGRGEADRWGRGVLISPNYATGSARPDPGRGTPPRRGADDDPLAE